MVKMRVTRLSTTLKTFLLEWYWLGEDTTSHWPRRSLLGKSDPKLVLSTYHTAVELLLTNRMSNFTPFSPPIPISRSSSTKEEIIHHITARMVKGIFNDGKGYSVDLAVVRSEVEGFANRRLRDKSLQRLRLIKPSFPLPLPQR
jgi:hypothetical protein